MAFVASIDFGVILIIDGDWIPGGIIVAAGLLGLAVMIPVMGKLCCEEPSPSPPRSKPAS